MRSTEFDTGYLMRMRAADETFSIGYDDEPLQERAQALANDLNLPLDRQHLPRLEVTHDKLLLLIQGYAPLFADFTSRSVLDRRQAGKSQGLVRACRPKAGLRMIDATAGWGKDAAILASFGAEVIMLERQPLMHALLADALLRSQNNISSAGLNLSLVKVDAQNYLKQLSPPDFPDVIYIDPMHPSRQKSALVKKEMQVLQQLIGTDDDVLALLQQAIRSVRQHVVMKWPQRLPPLVTPNYSIQGKTVRFDVYTPR
jgi:16S rRNA (guanine1516-N2)-methyltransferase